MKNKNNNLPKRTIVNSAQQTGRDIPFIWSSLRYKYENIYRLCFLGFLLAGVILIIACIIILSQMPGAMTSTSLWQPANATGVAGFISIMVSVTFKFSERKIRKVRIFDAEKSRTSTIL
jgi:hypothetical protein